MGPGRGTRPREHHQGHDFPHNIALGATRDVQLIREIGAVTAKEMRVTGQNEFRPDAGGGSRRSLGRTYESYSEDPRSCARLPRQW